MGWAVRSPPSRPGPPDCPSSSWLWGSACVIGDDGHLDSGRRSRAHAFPFPRIGCLSAARGNTRSARQQQV